MTITEILEESRKLEPQRVALTLLALVPYVLGWLVGQTFKVLWIVISFMLVACAAGYREANPKRGG